MYQVGTLIRAKAAPSVLLEIARYYKRIYYCNTVDDTSAKQKVYFERELIKQ